MIGIYKITNNCNRKVYIGQSINIERRIKAHLRHNKDSNNHLHGAINKYGVDNFNVDILIDLSWLEGHKKEEFKLVLDYWEKFYIRYYCSNNPNFGYNMTKGGQTAPSDRLSTNKKISLSKTGYHPTKETRNKMSRSKKGKPTWNKGKKGCFSDETIENFSRTRKGVPNKMKGKKYPEETRKRMGRKKGSIPWNKGQHKNKEIIEYEN